VALEVFDGVLGERPNQIERKREDVEVAADQLLDFAVPGGTVTEAGLRNNVSVALQYLASWLDGNGAVAIFNLMEDAATAEISRSQVWQWQRNRIKLAEGPPVTADLVRVIEDEELEKIRESMGEAFARFRWDEARRLFESVALAAEFDEFLTLPAYRKID
jgi:malate synthase